MASSSVPPLTHSSEFRALMAFVLLMGLVALFVVRTFLAPMVVAAWFAGLTSPLVHRLSVRLGGRKRVAAVATVLLVLIIVVPLVLLTLPLVGMISDVIDSLLHRPQNGLLRQLVDMASGPQRPAAAEGGVTGLMPRLMDLGRRIAPSAASLVRRTFSTVSAAMVQVFILSVSAYYFSAAGSGIMALMRRGSPLAPSHFRRLECEFMDVARAMLVGELLTAAVQGVVAGVIYALLRVPHALFFAVLTGFLALVPTLGSALVWIPLCGVLIAAGRVRDAVILAICGMLVIGTVDNVLRPYFSKLGADKLHPLLLFLGIFGGLEAFGAWGLILGPLTLSLFVAAYRLYAAEAEVRRAEAAADAPAVVCGEHEGQPQH